MSSVTPIRPKVLFKRCEQQLSIDARRYVTNIPSSEIGGLTLLEGAILVSLAKLIDATRLFEFGTFMGATTSLLAMNTADNTKIVTLDLPRELEADFDYDLGLVLSDGVHNDKYLSKKFIADGAVYLQGLDEKDSSKVIQLFQNSLTMDIDVLGLVNKFEFIFIDGGHDYDTVKMDTYNAIRMKSDNSVLVWHDYKSTIHGDVTTFVDEISKDYKIYHVENTMIAFTLFGSAQQILEA